MSGQMDVFSDILGVLENSKRNFFIAGRAGTGKSTLLRQFAAASKKRLAVLAPTGVAAVNISGQTIHSFFGFGPNITLEKVRPVRDNSIYTALDALAIDEISMVRADLLDCVDRFLRVSRNRRDVPFGGVQLIMFGDLHQLPPVVSDGEHRFFSSSYRSPYFFDSRAFNRIEFELIELDRIFRQKDAQFLGILDAVRHNRVTEQQLARLNSRVSPHFEPPENEFFIRLCTLNRMADRINERELGKIRDSEFCFRGAINGSFKKEYLPCEIRLKLKAGAQVMFLNNDSEGRWINGTIGKVTGFRMGVDNYSVAVEIPERGDVYVEPYTWKIFRPRHDPEKNSLVYEETGSFTQYPLKSAWAITIHKSQGKTFDKAIIDFGYGAFAPGQAYVALSRCSSLEGLVLRRPFERHNIMVDKRVTAFMERVRGTP